MIDHCSKGVLFPMLVLLFISSGCALYVRHLHLYILGNVGKEAGGTLLDRRPQQLNPLRQA